MARRIMRVVRSVRRPTFVKGLIIGSVVALGLFALIFKENAPQTHAEVWAQSYGVDFAQWNGNSSHVDAIVEQLPAGSVSLVTVSGRPAAGSGAFDSLDPRIARLVEGRWPTSESELVVERTKYTADLKIGDMRPYPRNNDPEAEVVGFFVPGAGVDPAIYALLGGSPFDLEATSVNAVEVTIFARLPKGVHSVDGFNRWQTAESKRGSEYPNGGASMSFICPFVPWQGEQCTWLSLLPDGGWLLGIEVAALTLLASLILTGATAMARALRRRTRWAPPTATRGWMASTERSPRWLLGLPIGIGVAWLAYLPLHVVMARQRVEHLRLTPSMLGPIAVACGVAIGISLVTWLAAAFTRAQGEYRDNESGVPAVWGVYGPSRRWVAAAALLTGGIATGFGLAATGAQENLSPTEAEKWAIAGGPEAMRMTGSVPDVTAAINALPSDAAFAELEQVPTSEGVTILVDGRKVWDEVLTITDGDVPRQPDEVAVVASASLPVLQSDGSWVRTSPHVGDTVHLTWLAQKRVVGTVAVNGPGAENLGMTGVVDPSARSTISPLATDQMSTRGTAEVWAIAAPGSPFGVSLRNVRWVAANGPDYDPNPNGFRVPVVSTLVGRWAYGTGFSYHPWLVRADGSWVFGLVSSTGMALLVGVGVVLAAALVISGVRRPEKTKMSSSAARIEAWFDRPVARATMFAALATSVAAAGVVAATLMSGHGHLSQLASFRITPSMLGPVLVGVAAYVLVLRLGTRLPADAPSGSAQDSGS